MFYASIIFEIFAYKYDFFVQLVQSILKYNRGIYMQNVLLRLREVQPSLSSTERQIAQFILENPDETTTLTIRDLARRSFSSPSSVVRICRVIGFQGYKELRHALTLELATLGENGSHREKDITPQDSLQEIVDKVTHKNIQSLLDTQRLLLLDELEQCVELIANESLFRNGAMSSRLSQLNVMDILYTAYASRNHEDTMRRLAKTHIYKPGDPEVLTQP